MAYMLAKNLASMNRLEVSALVYDYGQKSIEVREGVTILRSPVKRLNKYHSKLVKLNRKLLDRYHAVKSGLDINTYYKEQETAIYKSIAADMFLLFGISMANYKTACALNELGFSWTILLVHDEDVSRNYQQNTTFRNRHNGAGSDCYELIKMTERFVAQNEFQLSELQSFHKKNGILINTAIDFSNEAISSKEYILWVGRATAVKRPELFIELAKLLPNESFVMVTSDHDLERFKNLEKNAPKNMEIHKNIPFSFIDNYFKRAKLFVNTSISEGFPVTFLHAGKFAVPVYTLGVDPNGILNEKGGGKVFEHLTDITKHLNDHDLSELGIKLKELVRDLHDARKIACEIVEYIQLGKE